jgi:hypothetical protein
MEARTDILESQQGPGGKISNDRIEELDFMACGLPSNRCSDKLTCLLMALLDPMLLLLRL